MSLKTLSIFLALSFASVAFANDAPSHPPASSAVGQDEPLFDEKTLRILK